MEAGRTAARRQQSSPVAGAMTVLLVACSTPKPYGPLAKPELGPEPGQTALGDHCRLRQRRADVGEAEIGPLLNEGSLALSVDGLHNIRPKPDETCADAAGIEAMSQYVQKELGLIDYRRPLLVGVGLGASLVFLGLAESTPNTFLGGMALGFDPDWRSPWRLCEGDQGSVGKPAADGRGWQLAPSDEYLLRWTVLQGAADPTSEGRAVRRRAYRMPS